MSADIVIAFHPPAPPISMNDRKGKGAWTVIAEWRAAAYWYWCEAHPGVGPDGRAFGVPADVFTSLPFRHARGRDPINFAPTVKAIVDGLTDAGAWPDDTPDFVSQHIPACRVDDGGKVVVRVAPRGDL